MSVNTINVEPHLSPKSACPEVAELQAVFEEWVAGLDGIRVLEAGCGSASHLRWPAGAHITGLDISQKQLDRNTTVDEKILGDIQTYELPASSYDVIVCWDVLEHLPHPELAIRRFVQAIRPGGIIILAFPNVVSAKGLIAKFTPHWFHVWVYRHLMGIPDAGTEDTAPFKTFLRLSISPWAIRKTARRYGLELVHTRFYQTGMQKKLRSRYRFVNWAVNAVAFAIKVISLGRIDATLSDCMYVLRCPLSAAPEMKTAPVLSKTARASA